MNMQEMPQIAPPVISHSENQSSKSLCPIQLTGDTVVGYLN